MFSIIAKAQTKSTARLLRFFKTRKILLGERFSLTLELTNIGDPFSGGLLEVWVEWPNGQLVHYQQALQPLGKDEALTIERWNWEALTPGYALFYIRITAFIDEKSEEVAIFRSKDMPLPRLPDGRPSSFHSLFAVAKEEIYQYYALLVAIASLLIIVIEKAFWIWQQIAPIIEQLLRSIVN